MTREYEKVTRIFIPDRKAEAHNIAAAVADRLWSGDLLALRGGVGTANENLHV